jgi:hypothetical protein
MGSWDAIRSQIDVNFGDESRSILPSVEDLDRYEAASGCRWTTATSS